MLLLRPVASLKSRMTLVVTVLVFCSSILVALGALYLAERQMSQLVGEREYALLSSAAAHLEQDLAAKRTLLQAVGEGARAAGVSAGAPIQSYLERYTTLREEFFNVVAFDPDGALVASLADRRQVGTLSAARSAR